MEDAPQTDRVLQLQLRARELEELEGVIVRTFDDRLAGWIHKFVEALETNRANQKDHHLGIFVEYEPACDDEPESAWIRIVHGNNRESIKLAWFPQPVYVCGPRQICWDIDTNQPATEGLCPRCKGAAEQRKKVGMAHGSLGDLKKLLESLVDGDWFQDDNGIIWEWSFDIDANLCRWSEVDTSIVGSLANERERNPEFDGQHLEQYGYDGKSIFLRSATLGPYRILVRGS